MEASISQPRTGFPCPALSYPIKPSSTIFISRNRHLPKLPKLKCVEEGGEKSLEKDGVNLIELEQEVKGLGKLSEKCKEEIGGLVELLECLEKEALMGDDVGTHPNDYHRRALIFAHSSRIFQTQIKDTPSV